MPRTHFAPARRRRSPVATILAILLLIVIAVIVYAATIDTEVPTSRIEQDVTNEIQGG